MKYIADEKYKRVVKMLREYVNKKYRHLPRLINELKLIDESKNEQMNIITSAKKDIELLISIRMTPVLGIHTDAISSNTEIAAIQYEKELDKLAYEYRKFLNESNRLRARINCMKLEIDELEYVMELSEEEKLMVVQRYLYNKSNYDIAHILKYYSEWSIRKKFNYLFARLNETI